MVVKRVDFRIPCPEDKLARKLDEKLIRRAAGDSAKHHAPPLHGHPDFVECSKASPGFPRSSNLTSGRKTWNTERLAGRA